MVICWIMGSVSESIARLIMFIGTISEIWQQLERRFSLSAGSRKYKLNKDTYELTQSGCSVEEHYSHQRSQILMINPLPCVENACSLIQQEESQRMLLGSAPSHPPKKCWEKVGYPPWHPKSKISQANKQVKSGQVQGRNLFVPRTASHVESDNISFTPQQFEQLLKSVQQMGSLNATEEEIDHQFATCIACLNNQIDLLELLKDWIYDTGASDHMTPIDEFVYGPYLLKLKPQIKLPNGDTSVISHMGKGLTTRKVKGLGKKKAGLYHLVNVPSEKVDSVFINLVQSTMQKFAFSVVNKDVSNSYALWHHRLGHVSD
ncbi:hypothetical protein Tco_1489846 [Tanacetum coccineum]